jgi:hypothetical protein
LLVAVSATARARTISFCCCRRAALGEEGKKFKPNRSACCTRCNGGTTDLHLLVRDPQLWFDFVATLLLGALRRRAPAAIIGPEWRTSRRCSMRSRRRGLKGQLDPLSSNRQTGLLLLFGCRERCNRFCIFATRVPPAPLVARQEEQEALPSARLPIYGHVPSRAPYITPMEPAST